MTKTLEQIEEMNLKFGDRIEISNNVRKKLVYFSRLSDDERLSPKLWVYEEMPEQGYQKALEIFYYISDIKDITILTSKK